MEDSSVDPQSGTDVQSILDYLSSKMPLGRFPQRQNDVPAIDMENRNYNQEDTNQSISNPDFRNFFLPQIINQLKSRSVEPERNFMDYGDAYDIDP